MKQKSHSSVGFRAGRREFGKAALAGFLGGGLSVSSAEGGSAVDHKSSSVKLLCTTNRDHKPDTGSVAAVANAVRRGADLRRFSTYFENAAVTSRFPYSLPTS